MSPALQRWRWSGGFEPPRRLKVTRIGKVYLVITVGVGIAALNTGNNLLYLVLGMMLSAVVASGVLSERCLRGLSVRRLGADGAFAQEPFSFRWVLRAEGAPSLALSIREVGVAGEGQVGHLAAGEERTVRADMVAPRRGPLRLSAVEVTTTFPLGLFAKSRRYALPGTLLVFPRRVPAPEGAEAGREGPFGEAAAASLAEGAGDLAGLRELRDGEAARAIHWRRSARLARLVRVVREREERRTFELEVPAGEANEALDRRCERAAAVARRLLEAGHQVGLTTPGLRLRAASGPQHERRILTALATVGYPEHRK